VCACVGREDLAGSFVFHGLCMDVVAIVVVENEKFVAASARWSYESTGLVSENLARVGHAGCIAVVGARAIGSVLWKGIGSDGFGNG
jgi:hypothetical protein